MRATYETLVKGEADFEFYKITGSIVKFSTQRANFKFAGKASFKVNKIKHSNIRKFVKQGVLLGNLLNERISFET